MMIKFNSMKPKKIILPMLFKNLIDIIWKNNIIKVTMPKPFGLRQMLLNLLVGKSSTYQCRIRNRIIKLHKIPIIIMWFRVHFTFINVTINKNVKNSVNRVVSS